MFGAPLLLPVLALVLALGAACQGEEPPSAEALGRPLAELASVVGDDRFTAPWLSAFPEHRPCLDADAGYCPDRAEPPGKDLARWAADQARPAAAAGVPDAARLHARGIWHLLFPPDGPGEAVAALGRARDLAPNEWRVRNDLAAAELLRGLGGEPLRLLDALAEAEAAVEITPDALPPRFNLALTLETLGLREDARRAWRNVLDREPPRAWQDEAEARQSEPETPDVAGRLRKALALGDREQVRALAATAPQAAYGLGVEELLPRWARAVTATDERAAEHPPALLDAVRLLGEAVVAATGDRFVLATADRAAGLVPDDRLRLADAILRLDEGRARYDAREIEAAERALHDARRALDGLDTPLDPWIDYRLLLCAYWRQEPDLDRRLRALRAELSGGGWPILEGYTLWAAGLIDIDAGRFVTGRHVYRRATDRFEETSMESEAALLRTLLSDVEARLGDLEGAWTEALAAISRADALRKPRHRWAAWDQAARIASLVGHDRAALRFQEAALRAAEGAASPSTVSSAYAARAGARHRVGDGPGAQEDLEQARLWAARITDESARHRAEASILLAQSRSGEAGETAPTIERLTLALERYRQIDAPVLYPELLLERSRLLARTGDPERAHRDLLDGLEAMREQGRRLDALDERLSFARAARRAIEALLARNLGPDGDPGAVPTLSDLARDPLRAGPPTLDADTLRLVPGEAVLSVTALPGRLVLWAAHDGRSYVVTEPVDDEVLRRRLASATEDPTADDLGWFYDRMVRPHLPRLRDTDRLFIALDRGLYGLPVGALIDRATGRHMVEDRSVAVVPAIGALTRPRGLHTADAPMRLALMIAPAPPVEAPAGVGGRGHSGMERLPGVEREAEALTELYPETKTLAPPVDASRLAAAGTWADVLHIAGHAVANPVDPGLSYLVTGQEPLYAHEIRSLRLSRRSTVILAACDTGVTAPEDGSGSSSLAAAFLEAGSQWVVGASRPLDDDAARRFTERLHRDLRQGLAPDRALRATQVHFLRSGALPLREWAAYQAFTG